MPEKRKKSGNDQILGPDILSGGSLIKEGMAAGMKTYKAIKDTKPGKDLGAK